MGLSDPFNTTYQGSMQAGESLGQGIQSAAGNVADVMKQKNALALQAKQRQDSFNMLKQFGLIKEETTPPSIDDLKSGLQAAGNTMGKDVHFNMASDLDEGQQRNFLSTLYKKFGVPMPQGKTTTTVTPGVTMDLGGGSKFESKEKPKTALETVSDYNAAQKLLQQSGLDGQVTSGSKGVTIKQPTGTGDNLTNAGLTPDVINNSTPEDRQSIVKEKNPSYFNKLEMLKDGNMPTSGRTSKELQQMYGDAGVLWPGEVDATKGVERTKMAQNIAGGDIFKSSMRGNTLVGHMDTLFNTMEKLKNMQLRLGNVAKNTAEYQAGAKEIQSAKQASLAVANEMEGYLRNSNVMSELGIQQQLENIPVNGSPEQQQAWMETAGELFNQRRNAINDTVKNIMGPKYKFDVLSEKSKKILAKHGISTDDDGASSSQGQMPSQVQSQAPQQNQKVDYKSKYGLS